MLCFLGVLLAAPVSTEVPGEVALHARSVGEGPVLIAVHGGPGGSISSMTPLDVLADARAVVAYDQRGAGASGTPSDPAEYDLPFHVADLERVRKAYGADTIDLLGHSWGGLVAMAYAAAHPDRVGHLVLVGSTAPTREGHGRVEELIRINRRRVEWAGGSLPDKPDSVDVSCTSAWNWMRSYYADPARMKADHLEGVCHPGVLRQTWQAVGDYDIRAQLAPLTLPVLAINGDSDPIAIAAAPEIKQALGKAAVEEHWLSDCGHRPMFECPDPFFAKVRAFLDAPPAQ